MFVSWTMISLFAILAPKRTWFRTSCGTHISLCNSVSTGVLGHIVRQELQDPETMEVRVLCLIDHSEPAANKLFEDALMRGGPMTDSNTIMVRPS